MTAVPEIAEFAALVEPYLDDNGADSDSDTGGSESDQGCNGTAIAISGSRILTYSTAFLTKPGDNYGSVILSVLALIRRCGRDDTAAATIEELSLVAKLPPILNDLYWAIFQPERTCRTENAIYERIAPALRRLQRESGVPSAHLFNGFPRYYGSRISLAPSAVRVDRDALLVLENLQTCGYRAGDRHVAYDRPHTRLVLQQLAQFHALPIALRLLRSAQFEEVVRPHTRRFSMNAGLVPEMMDQFNEELFKEVLLASNNDEAMLQRIKDLKQRYDEYIEGPDATDTPYTTVAHCDLWINNIMIQYDGDGAPHKLKFVDFQIAQYQSLAHDLVFFLLSSVATDLLAAEYEALLQVYHEAFVDCLTQVGVDTHVYTYAGLLAEVRRVAPLEVPHALFMVKVVLADNSTLPEDFKDLDLQVLSDNSGRRPVVQKTADILRLSQQFQFI